MSTVQLLVVCLTALALAFLAIVALVVHGNRSVQAEHVPLVRSGRVALHMAEGQSVIGNVVPGPDGFITLVAAELRTPGRQAQGMADPVVLRESAITLAQTVGPPTERLTDPHTGMSRDVPVRNGTSA